MGLVVLAQSAIGFFRPEPIRRLGVRVVGAKRNLDLVPNIPGQNSRMVLELADDLPVVIVRPFDRGRMVRVQSRPPAELHHGMGVEIGGLAPRIDHQRVRLLSNSPVGRDFLDKLHADFQAVLVGQVEQTPVFIQLPTAFRRVHIPPGNPDPDHGEAGGRNVGQVLLPEVFRRVRVAIVCNSEFHKWC